jgi:hypothetical protein
MHRGCAKGYHANDVANRDVETAGSVRRITSRIFPIADASDAGPKPYPGGALEMTGISWTSGRFPESSPCSGTTNVIVSKLLHGDCLAWAGVAQISLSCVRRTRCHAICPLCNEIHPSKRGLGIFRRLKSWWVVNTRSPHIVHGECRQRSTAHE